MTAHDHIEQRSEIAIRPLGADDAIALEELAQRDSAPTPAGTVLGAVVDGQLVAAVSVDSGESLADPFLPSAGMQALLVERARQLRGRGRGSAHRWSLRGLGRRRPARARATLAASPPGAGGRLLRLG